MGTDAIMVTPVQETPVEQSQPQEIDDNAVREAIAKAESTGIDPMTLSVQDLEQKAVVPETPKQEVPAKFLKPDGEVDVEKIKASTKQLDEAIAKKEQAIQKSIDDYVAEYRAKETKMRDMPNPQKVEERVREEVENPILSIDDLKQRIFQNYQQDPVGTLTNLADEIAERKFAQKFKNYEPIIAKTKEQMESEQVRSNLKAINDPRIFDQTVFDAINKKLAEDPGLRQSKNPHRAAWLEVKEELRLGDLNMRQAPPSTPPPPVLGGGTPPPTPSSQPAVNPLDPIGSIYSRYDIRNKNQESQADEEFRQYLAAQERR